MRKDSGKQQLSVRGCRLLAANPGGNITGFMSNEPILGGKWPELLKEIAPGVARVGFLFNPDTAPYAEPFLRHAESAARLLGIEVAAARVRNDAEIEHAIAGIASNPGGGLIVLPESTTNARFELIIAVAARHRVPAIYAYRYQATAGGLISYGVDIADLFRGAAVYVDNILRGDATCRSAGTGADQIPACGQSQYCKGART
jgi:putative tryptophan/tyrosine transport system substrate-binding protein